MGLSVANGGDLLVFVGTMALPGPAQPVHSQVACSAQAKWE